MQNSGDAVATLQLCEVLRVYTPMIDLAQLATNILVSATTAGVTLHLGLKHSRQQHWWAERWNTYKLAIASLVRMERYPHSYLRHMEHLHYGGICPDDDVSELKRDWQEGLAQIGALSPSGELLLSTRTIELLNTLRSNLAEWQSIGDSDAEAELQIEAITTCLTEIVNEAKQDLHLDTALDLSKANSQSFARTMFMTREIKHTRQVVHGK